MRLVVFDCDGTLVDSQFRIHEAMRRAFARDSREAPDLAAVRELIGLSLELTFARLLPAASPEQRQRIRAAYRHEFAALCRDEAPEPLFPGIQAALLQRVAAGDRLAIATGKGRRALRELLEAHGILGCFQSLMTADDGPGKPNPALLLQAMHECAATPDLTFMVGDTSFDMEMAVRAGVTALGVAWGYHSPAALRAAGASEVLQEAAELGPLLDRLRPNTPRNPGG